MSMTRTHRIHGAALDLLLHVVLLLLVLGQVVFLATAFRSRFDLTAERAYTVTDSTRSMVGNLDQQLVVECYFSPKEVLPADYRETRTILDNFLDELVQMGRGRVVLRRLNPLDDKAITDTCTRLGIQPLDLQTGTATSLSVNRHWQGLRLLHGGEKQKVIPRLTPVAPFHAEATVAIAIKEVTTGSRRKIGFMEWGQDPPMGARTPPLFWNQVRTAEDVAKRYEFQNVKDAEEALIPAEIGTLVLFHPRDLSDRQKYVIDQFVMRGGNLVAFVDAVDYQIGEQRAFNRLPLQFDAQASSHRFLDQLLHYGIEVRPKVVVDMAPEAQQPRDPLRLPMEYFTVVRPGPTGQPQAVWTRYPYFFHPIAFDWSQAATRLATDQTTGSVDAQLAEQYRRRFRPGIDSAEFLWNPFKQLGRGPGFYWPCPVDLRRKNGEPDLPPGVTGEVMLWSSPLSFTEDPPPNANPVGSGDPQSQNQVYQRFMQNLMQRYQTEPRQQTPLMAQVQGVFDSWFAGKERPRRPAEIKAEAARKAEAERREQERQQQGEDPLQQPVREQPDPQPPTEPEIGPPAPPKEQLQDADLDAPPVEPEPDPIARGTAPGRIVVVGDSDFLRDDLVRGDHAQRGGPYSLLGAAFWLSLLDWLAQDRDLLALQSRAPVDRALRFVEPEPGAVPGLEQERRVQRKIARVLWLNVLVPPALLALIGFGVFLLRRSQKRSFLESVQG